MGNAKQQVQALLFDVFGTVVDWRGSLIRELTAFGDGRGLKHD
jgi:2-haloacid dehalogenase